MLKREIAYEDFNGNQVTDIFYFNISKPELIELEVEHEGGFSAIIQNIVDSKDHKALIQRFKEIVLMAYGQKSDDGKRFIKSEQLRNEFSQTAAYSALFMELAMDDNAAVIFLKNTLPKDMAGEFDKAAASTTPTPIIPTPNN